MTFSIVSYIKDSLKQLISTQTMTMHIHPARVTQRFLPVIFRGTFFLQLQIPITATESSARSVVNAAAFIPKNGIRMKFRTRLRSELNTVAYKIFLSMRCVMLNT